MTAPVVIVDQLAVHFGGRKRWFSPAPRPVRAVDGITFSIARGETLALVGESGCGKSTVSNAILGVVPVTAGSIKVGDLEVAGASRETLHDMRRRVQLVFQDPQLSLNPRMTVGAAISEPLAVRGLAHGTELTRRVGALMAAVGLRPEHAARYPHQFSGGQRQRVVIARALAVEPDLVVCDEPVSALDVSVRAQILNLLAQLQRERGIAYLFISHDLGVVRHVADRVAVMYLGRLVEIATRDALFDTPKHPYTKALLAAVPEPDPVRQRQKARIVLGGELPSPSNVPTGCAFNARCPLATELCRSQRPELTAQPDGTVVACHHV